MHDDDDDDHDEGIITDAELVQEFNDFYDRTDQLARSAMFLTEEEKRRAVAITTSDLAVAFDLDEVRVKRVQRLRRKLHAAPLQKGQKRPEADLKNVVPQQGSRAPKTASAPRLDRIDPVAPVPREGSPEAQIPDAAAS